MENKNPVAHVCNLKLKRTTTYFTQYNPIRKSRMNAMYTDKSLLGCIGPFSLTGQFADSLHAGDQPVILTGPLKWHLRSIFHQNADLKNNLSDSLGNFEIAGLLHACALSCPLYASLNGHVTSQ